MNLLKSLCLSTDLDKLYLSVDETYSSRINNLSANIISAESISAQYMQSNNFVTYRDGKPEYINDIPYSHSIIAGKSIKLPNISLGSSIIIGLSNTISSNNQTTVNSIIVGGQNNKLIAPSIEGMIVSGKNNNVKNAPFSIIAGNNNAISYNSNSFIIGEYNQLSTSENFNGSGNFICGKLNTINLSNNAQFDATTAFVIGIDSHANCGNTFIWNTTEKTTGKHNAYYDHGHGTFNINPQNGLSGFYIGNYNFIDCVLSAIQCMSLDQKNVLKTILNV